MGEFVSDGLMLILRGDVVTVLCSPIRGGVTQLPNAKRAGEGNRTPVPSLGSLYSAIELHPQGASSYCAVSWRGDSQVPKRL